MPNRQQILDFIESSDRKVGKREIARAFNVRGADRVELKRLLRQMAQEGLIEGPRSRLRKPGDLPAVSVLLAQGVDDQGDLIGVPADWDDESGPPPQIIIRAPGASGRKARATRNRPTPGVGDRILARLSRDETLNAYVARTIKVLRRQSPSELGIMKKVGSEYRAVPINRRGTEYLIPKSEIGTTNDGDLVRVEPLGSPRRGPAKGRVTERIGSVSSERAASLIALVEHDIPYVFPADVLEEADAAPPADLIDREDWRDLPFITIDPHDARDHDDAVYAIADEDGKMEVRVAIADVAWHVQANSAMNKEARRRGNSVYFPGRVVPMLPERISNDLCSLKQGESRPALAVRMVFDASGRKLTHQFHRVMIRSAAALSYTQAQLAIDGDPDDLTKPLMKDVLRPLWNAYKVLQSARDLRAPLDLNLPERKVILNENGAVDRIVIPPRLDSHRLIEEFMIQANVAAAETLEKSKARPIYRIHDEPTWDKLDALRDFLKSMDMSLPKSGNIRAAQFNQFLEQVAGTRHEIIVNEVVLRSQSQAEYSTENIGHFGLNLPRYTHFTSPIRRYADLLVHRGLISGLSLGQGGLRPGDDEGFEEICGEISMTERRAMAAERDTVDRLMASWLSERIGARFSGRIRGVTRAGLFVELEDLGADGFVPIGSIDEDYYLFDESHHRIVGRSSGRTFQLGESVEVCLIECLPFAGSLRFEILTGGHFQAGKGPRVRLDGEKPRSVRRKGRRRERKK